MRATITLLIVIAITFSCAHKEPGVVKIPKSDIKRAKKFGLEFVETYFTKDSKTFYSYLSDPVYLMNRGEMVKKIDIRNEVLDRVPTKLTDETKRFKDYKKNYEALVFSRDEIMAEDFEYGHILGRLSGLNLTQFDYLFLGNTIRTHDVVETIPPPPGDSTSKPTKVTHTEPVGQPFMEDEPLIFVVRGTRDHWYIVAFNL